MKAKIKQIIYSLLVAITLVVAPPLTATAGALGGCNDKITFFPAWYQGMCKDDKGNIKSPTDMSGANTGEKLGKWVAAIAMNIVSMLLYVVGYASLIFIIYGGFKFLINGDNSSGTVAARKTIQNAVIGLVLSIASVSLVSFIASRIVEG